MAFTTDPRALSPTRRHPTFPTPRNFLLSWLSLPPRSSPLSRGLILGQHPCAHGLRDPVLSGHPAPSRVPSEGGSAGAAQAMLQSRFGTATRGGARAGRAKEPRRASRQDALKTFVESQQGCPLPSARRAGTGLAVHHANRIASSGGSRSARPSPRPSRHGHASSQARRPDDPCAEAPAIPGLLKSAAPGLRDRPFAPAVRSELRRTGGRCHRGLTKETLFVTTTRDLTLDERGGP